MTDFDRLKAIVSTALKIAPEEIEEKDSFGDDLGADSLDMVRILDGVEKEFGIVISESDEESFETVGSCLDYLRRKLSESA